MTDQNPSAFEFRILLVAPNWLGDAVMFSALIEFLHQRRILPDGTQLTLGLAVRPAWAPLFKDDPRLSFLVPVLKPGRHSGLLGGFRLGADFRALNLDAVVLGPPSLRFGLAAFFSGANLRIGYSGDGRGMLLTHGAKILQRGHRHHSDELVQLGKNLFQALGWGEHDFNQADVAATLPGCLEIQPTASSSEAPLWVFAPGATYGSAKSWPLDRAVEFARQAIEERKIRLVVVGDASAANYASELIKALSRQGESQLNGSAGIVDLTGQTDLTQVTGVIKSCEVFVGNDSGLMHLSGALGIPTLGIFGSSNPHWTSPQGSRTAFVVASGFECHPCYLKTCNQKEFCLDTIDSGQIMAAVDKLLDGQGN